MKELEDTKVRLEKEIFEKDDHIRKLTIELAANDISETDTQNPALMATIESLETIIGQKEETINRLQELLKECREDHTKEIMELQKKAEAQNVDTKEKQVSIFIKMLKYVSYLHTPVYITIINHNKLIQLYLNSEYKVIYFMFY